MRIFLRPSLFFFLLFIATPTNSFAQENCEGIPAPWTSQDIGNVGIEGTACELNGIFEVNASGADIWGTNDEFHFVYQAISADGEIVVRVDGLENTNDWAKAGVMMRNSTADDAAMILLSISPNPKGLGLGYTLQDRPFDGATMNSAQNNIGPQPINDYPFYLRLVREGNTFSGYGSATNGNWVLLGTKTISMNEEILVGMATTSHSNQELTTASYSNVSIESESLDQERPFITTWKTDNNGASGNNQITIPTYPGEAYNYSIDWGDGTSDIGVAGDITHTYENVGIYDVAITGEFAGIYFNSPFDSSSRDNEKLLLIKQWGTVELKRMDSAYAGCLNLDIVALDAPNLENVNTLNATFQRCISLIGTDAFDDWNTSSIVAMYETFFEATSFNAPIGRWDMSNVVGMNFMFGNANSFNQEIGDWDVRSVNEMAFAFTGALEFNQDISNWDVKNTGVFANLFSGAAKFNQNLESWNLSNARELAGMFENSGLSTQNYDALLNGWSRLELNSGLFFGAGNIQYCQGEAARQKLIDDFGWNIMDGGKATENCFATGAFVTTWKTDNPGGSEDNQITIPTASGETYDYTVDWGDGTITTGETGDATHTYGVPGTYQVSISGVFPRIFFNGITTTDTDANKIVTINQWGNIRWTSMERSFEGCGNLDVTATDAPNLELATSLSRMFSECTSLVGNESFGFWEVGTIEDMSYMFNVTFLFKQDIGNWDVSNVRTMNHMFHFARFNEDLAAWNVSNVTDMGSMFGQSSFNQDIGRWNVVNVRNMSFMFFDSNFDQNLGKWSVINVENMNSMFEFSALSVQNYDGLLQGWSRQSLQNGVVFGANNSQYCLGEAARQKLIDDFGWNITDGGRATENCFAADAFVTTWKTNNHGVSEDNQIELPLIYGGDYMIDWGDGTSDSGTTIHTYEEEGIYQVAISGDFFGLQFGSYPGDTQSDAHKLLEVNQWGDMVWTTMLAAFSGCENLDVVATDIPNLSTVDSFSSAFSYCTNLKGNQTFNSWDVSSITDMTQSFYVCTNFDADISNWDVSNVTSMANMFLRCENFNQDISSWKVGNVTKMNGMFSAARKFDQPIGNWDVSNVTNMSSMFQGSAFNSDIGSWNVSKVTEMGGMFNFDSKFNQDIGSWNVSNVVDLQSMFYNNRSFNQDLSDWDVNSVANMYLMFSGATGFDQSLGNWDVSSVTRMDDMFFESGLTTANYDATLIGWASLPTLQPNVPFDGGNTQYCESEAARQKLIDDFGWNITDGGKSSENCNTEVCTDALENEDPSIVLSEGRFVAGLDVVVGTSEETNNSTCALIVTNSDEGPSVARYHIPIDLALNGIEAGDELFIGIDGNSSQGRARIELNQDNSVNSALAANTFGSDWSRYESTITVPSGISTLDIWLFSNYLESEPGSAVYDNLIVRKVDAGLKPFITVWKTDNPGVSADNQITIPTFTGETYNYSVDWGDGSSSTGVAGGITHTYESAGTYEVAITGEFPRIFFNGFVGFDQDDYGKLLEVKQWGDISWTSMKSAFDGCYNLNVTANDVPDLSGVTSLLNMFISCNSLQDNPSFNDWDVSTITSMSGMFFDSSFNSNIADWDVSNVEEMVSMFFSTPFDKPLENWDTGKVRFMGSMFYDAAFDQDISQWDVSEVEDMQAMFFGAGLSTSNYDKTLVGWASLPTLQPNVSFDAGNSQFCQSEVARQKLIDLFNWEIVDGGKSPENCTNEPCPNFLENEDTSVSLSDGRFVAGLDFVNGTSEDTNGSACSLEVININDGSSVARYHIPIDLAANDIQAGDELFIGIDGKSATGRARIELNQNNSVNSALAAHTFSANWSRYESTITVPEGITTLDIWLFSNYLESEAGFALYDNLTVTNLSAGPELPNVEKITLAVGIPGDPIQYLSYELVEGGILDPIRDAGGYNFDLRANVNDLTQSVLFELNGERAITRIDSTDPFMVFGEEVIFDMYNFEQGSYQLRATPYDGPNGTGIAGEEIVINFTVQLIQNCPEGLDNDAPSIVLPVGNLVAGLDFAEVNSDATNNSPCGLSISNFDSGASVARYHIPIDLAANGIAAGDELFIGIDGKDSGGRARIELNQDNRVNSALAAYTFASDWSRYEATVVVPVGITTLDIWLFSNYLQNVPGASQYDNLTVVNLGTAENVSKNGAPEAGGLNIYPNPSSRVTTIGLENPTSVGIFYVYDMAGRLMQKVDVDIKAQQGYEMNVQSLPIGTYVVIATDNDGQVFTKQLVIKR